MTRRHKNADAFLTYNRDRMARNLWAARAESNLILAARRLDMCADAEAECLDWARRGSKDRALANEAAAAQGERLRVRLTQRLKRAEHREALEAEAEAERMYEMRAAFGPGQTVVDVLTGKTYRT